MEDHFARVEFPFGQCAMSANDQRLELIATAETKGDLARLEEVLGNHLERYAFRENPEVIWKRASAVRL